MEIKGDALQSYNEELVKAFDDLIRKRYALQESIREDETSCSKMEAELHRLQHQLAQLNTSLINKRALRSTYDKALADFQSTYMHILEKSQTLLVDMKEEDFKFKAKHNLIPKKEDLM